MLVGFRKEIWLELRCEIYKPATTFAEMHYILSLLRKKGLDLM